MSIPTPSTADAVRAYYRTVAPFIDRELDGRGDLAFWARRAREAAGRGGSAASAGILELGCGTGRVTAALAASGLPVTGVDLSPDMLARARRRVATLPAVLLLRADMRTLPVAGPFALVVAADDPFAHLTDDVGRRRALAAAVDVLAPGGRLLLETFHMEPERLQEARSPGGWRHERPLGDDADVTVRETWRCDPEGPLCSARYAYLRKGVPLAEAAFTSRMWAPGEVDAALARAGLEPRRRWGGWDDVPAEPTAPVIVVEAVRAAASRR